MTVLNDNDIPAALPSTLDEDLIEILGRPNFQCIRIAQFLRASGRTIPRRSENEQAETIMFLLRHWANDKENWRDNAEAALQEIIDAIKDDKKEVEVS